MANAAQTYTFEELSEAFNVLIQQRHSEIRDAGKEITKLLSSSNRVLKVTKNAAPWRKYVDYFSNIVIQGFSKAITCTIRHLLSQVRVAAARVRGCTCACAFTCGAAQPVRARELRAWNRAGVPTLQSCTNHHYCNAD